MLQYRELDRQLMPDYYGITVLCIAAAGYYLSWRYHQACRYRLAIALLVLCGLGLRIYLSCDLFLHPWDERYHALVAKNMMKHFLVPTLYDSPALPYSFQSWTTNHIWLHKQPLPLWSIALSLRMFGINEIAVRIPSILIGAAGIALTYSITDYISGRKAAYIAAFLCSINGLIIETGSGRVATDHVDMFFLFFISLAVFFTIRFVQRRSFLMNLLAGISIGLAVLCKWLPAFIVLPVWLLMVLDSGSFSRKEIAVNFLVLCASATAVFLPWQLYIFHEFPLEAHWEFSFNARHIFEVLDEQGGPYYYYLTKIRIIFGELVYIPLLWFLWSAVKRRSLKRLAICCWIVLPLIFFSIAATKMQGYILFVAPAMFIVIADFWVQLDSYYPRKVLMRGFRSVILILLLALPVRYCIERLKPFGQTERNPAWVQDLKKLNEKRYVNAVLLNYENPVEAMFYADVTAYSDLSDKKTIVDLMQRGHTIIIAEKENIPTELREIKGVIFEKIHPVPN